jgi:hypothetical protein
MTASLKDMIRAGNGNVTAVILQLLRRTSAFKARHVT